MNERESFGDSDSNNNYDEYVLTISENGQELKIDTRIMKNGKVSTQTKTYFMDGRGEANLIKRGKIDNFSVDSKTLRKKDKVTVKYKYKLKQGSRRANYNGTYSYEIKSGGNRLIFTHVSRGEFPDVRPGMGLPSSSTGVYSWTFDKLPL